MRRLRFLLPVALAASVPAALAQSSSPTAVEERLQQLESRITQLENRLANVSISPAESDSVDRVEALDQKLRILERNNELEQENFVAKSKETPVVAAGEDGFSIRSADKAFQLKVGGYVHADSRSYFDDSSHVGTDSFVLRRVRPIFQGTVFKFVDFRIMPDFGEGKSVLQDAYLDVKFLPAAALRAGKFKAPVGLERLQSATDIFFVERALPTNLVPNRDDGVEVWGEIANVNYAFGLFNGAPDGSSVDVDSNDGKDLAARVFATPFAKSAGHPLQGLGFGASVTTGRQEGSVLPSFKTSGQSTFFSYVKDASADGRRLRYSPQAYFFYGPFGVIGEYVQSNQQVALGTTHGEIANHAWQVSGSYFITGEKNGFNKRGAPRRKFEGISGAGSGAWELVARVSELTVDGAAFASGFADISKSAQAAQTWSVGVNWYLNRYTKFLFNFDQTHFTGGAASGDRPTENALLNRLQVSF